ncbi:MAG: serine/threonine protein phosphatase [Leptolyngbya sp. UWPOB_LEPTO1]|uniref:metallophosphoesterase family protein n=1 Tax=Leptolyngbya sp. UWPOB_LEPTO1 TaxID=2815653 RepID=UPI001ACF4153|nr:metallophosphoesterase family protein [Leptolyngbya sp. UWPOB_LEPTO1]MBN8563343.1 serine/threonine protein phosphatase [Leptolyngbya sp. UWPOB_LEPTO1]
MSQQPTRRIVIGDVHGHYDGLMNLLDTIAPEASDQVYFLGDLIDRGPQSYQVIEFVKNSPYQSLLGNHEHLLLEAFPNGQVYAPALQAWLQSGGRATVASYTDMDVLVEHVQWIRTLPTYLDLGDVWLVHAGVHPEMPLEQQGYAEFCWIRDEFHRSTQPYFSDKVIITGHTITFTFQGVVPGAIAQGQGWLGIDTGAYHPKSGWLTALDIDNAIVHQANMYTNQVRTLGLDEVTTKIEPQPRGRQVLKR